MAKRSSKNHLAAIGTELARTKFMTIDEALDHELVHTVFLDREAGIVKFQFGAVPTILTALIVQNSIRSYALIVSHKFKTSPAHTCSLPAFRNCRTPGEALHELFIDFSREYSFARKTRGHPAEDWFAANINLTKEQILMMDVT
jgi:hypothetical protein